MSVDDNVDRSTISVDGNVSGLTVSVDDDVGRRRCRSMTVSIDDNEVLPNILYIYIIIYIIIIFVIIILGVIPVITVLNSLSLGFLPVPNMSSLICSGYCKVSSFNHHQHDYLHSLLLRQDHF